MVVYSSRENRIFTNREPFIAINAAKKRYKPFIPVSPKIPAIVPDVIYMIAQ